MPIFAFLSPRLYHLILALATGTNQTGVYSATSSLDLATGAVAAFVIVLLGLVAALLLTDGKFLRPSRGRP